MANGIVNDPRLGSGSRLGWRPRRESAALSQKRKSLPPHRQTSAAPPGAGLMKDAAAMAVSHRRRSAKPVALRKPARPLGRCLDTYRKRNSEGSPKLRKSKPPKRSASRLDLSRFGIGTADGEQSALRIKSGPPQVLVVA
jgi:hypothetical protein